MRPSGVRKKILDEHAQIRWRLDELESLAAAVERDGAAALTTAVAKARAFYDLLREHIDLEDGILAPALREADAWGDVRAEQLLDHHRAQRSELRELSSEAAGALEPAAFVERLRKLIGDIRTDMLHEEGGVLSTELLRDDLIGIDVEGG